MLSPKGLTQKLILLTYSQQFDKTPDATGVGNGTTSAIQSSSTPTQRTQGAGFLKRPGAEGTDTGKASPDNTSESAAAPGGVLQPATSGSQTRCGGFLVNRLFPASYRPSAERGEQARTTGSINLTGNRPSVQPVAVDV